MCKMWIRVKNILENGGFFTNGLLYKSWVKLKQLNVQTFVYKIWKF